MLNYQFIIIHSQLFVRTWTSRLKPYITRYVYADLSAILQKGPHIAYCCLHHINNCLEWQRWVWGQTPVWNSCKSDRRGAMESPYRPTVHFEIAFKADACRLERYSIRTDPIFCMLLKSGLELRGSNHILHDTCMRTSLQYCRKVRILPIILLLTSH